MKKILVTLTFCLGFNVFTSSAQTKTKEQIQATINLDGIEKDRVPVTVYAPKIKSSEIVYHIPKMVPGTYSEDDFGRFIDDFKAYNKKGAYLNVSKVDTNSWKISGADQLASVSYWVNDTYDIESTHQIFSPVGSNIDAGKNILLNTHCFVGYFDGFKDLNYKMTVQHPATLWGATSMTDSDASNTNDVFNTSRYAELVENPVMYSKPDYSTFKVNDMEILIAVYSPNSTHNANEIAPAMKTMMTAQKNFLGKFNSTKKYSVLIYLSDMQVENDAHGFGALEHPTATTVVMPEMMGVDELNEQLKDVVSHEFFHIVTPLTIHSEEIQNFDYADPKMSQHLWMYEGVTEYFANLFQVNQGLISENDFLMRMAGKISNASAMNDTLPFTVMSANVLKKPFKDQYLNVYEKGALIGMCLDIIIREKSNGSRGILDLMQQLSLEYGIHKSFKDQELFTKIVSLTYPEVGEFLTTHVSGGTPIPYETYFAKMGVTSKVIKSPGNPFIKDAVPFIAVDQNTKAIFVRPDTELNVFYTELGIQGGDIIKEVNMKPYNLDNIYELIQSSQIWQENEPISVKISRDGKEQVINGKTKIPSDDKVGYQATDDSKKTLREAWLKG
ncbi:peptidase M61 [Flavobacterium sp. CYK-4]|uniref:M61 family metallopeptidase n=1 Tax=Flavobacterium lotistagni TaxID=2709660 RepID=UPI001407B3A9|nr:peptidase M61 [Flavobacterium lotistagni]NHM06374.1 peptidase M61 [Flavobacterium lotistagni]